MLRFEGAPKFKNCNYKIKLKMPRAHLRKKCHICGDVQRRTDLVKRHYPRFHPSIEPDPLDEHDCTTKLIDPMFHIQKPWMISNKISKA